MITICALFLVKIVVLRKYILKYLRVNYLETCNSLSNNQIKKYTYLYIHREEEKIEQAMID